MNTLRNAFFVCLIAALAASAAVDPTLLNLVMPDAKVISGMQVDASRSSRFGQYVLSQMQADDEGFRKFVAETGFDPRQDLSELVVATGATTRPAFLVVGKGRFNPARIMTAARTAGAGLTSYNGIDLITHSGQASGAVAFMPDATIALMGSLDEVKSAIDRYNRKGSGALAAETLDRIRALSAENDAWFLTTGPLTDFFAGKIADPNLSGAMAGNLLQAVLRASGGIKFAPDNVRISGEALTRSDKDATALADVVRFIAGLVQLNKDADEQAKKIASLVDTMTVTTQASTMRLSLSIPEELMEQLFMPQMNPAGKAGRTRKSAALR